MNYTDKDFLILLATCQITKGKNKNILVNYANDSIYDITDEHINILELLKSRPIIDVEQELDDEESRKNYAEFLKFLLDNEMGFITSSPELFPDISRDIYNDCAHIIDGIIEVSKESSISDVGKFCKEIAALDCKEIQLWIVDDIDLENVDMILNMTLQYNYSYVELHTDFSSQIIDVGLLRSTIEKFPNLKKVYVYSAKIDKKIDVVNFHEGKAPLSLGEIHLVKQDFNQGRSCGQIQFKSLDFSGYWVNNLMRKKNGCLYKKISLDRLGNIKNCPCLESTYGHISGTEVKNVVISKGFQRWGEIAKDEISECKDCAYRYNCSDCRAFRCDKCIYSKPQKCSYNPYTDIWK